MIYSIKNCIPKSLHKDIYHTLFESHLMFGISVWGGVSHNKLQPLFITQKKCLRILFGDTEVYKDKFKTGARCREFDLQRLGVEFFRKENTKPLFTEKELLTVHNLYTYHCIVEIFKILKFRIPISLYSIFTRSQRKETLLITPVPSTNFNYMSSHLWNTYRQVTSTHYFTNISISFFKSSLKKLLLEAQKMYDPNEWCDLNLQSFSQFSN